MKFCNKCVIPETAETQTFDDGGTCSVCINIDSKNKIDWSKRQEDLDLIIEKYKGKYEYDCIVPFSGGKDSTFALWYLVKEKKLRPLVVRFDHNFLRRTIEENTQKTLNILGVDFINFKPNFLTVKKMMTESLLRRGDFCWHCHVGIHALPMNTAIKRNIPLLFYGEPSSEYSSFYTYDEIEEVDVEKFNKATNLGINAEDMLEMINERFPEEKLTQKYDYEKIECMMQGVRDYIRYLKRGFGRTSHLTSIDIRNNRMKRSEAVELVKMYDGKKPKALDIFLNILDISEDDFYDIIEKHVISPHAFPKREILKNNTSNITPRDIQDWIDKFN